MKRIFFGVGMFIVLINGMLVCGISADEPPEGVYMKAKKTDTSSQGMSSLSGKITETMNSGGYTYLCIEKDSKKTWVAIPETKVTVGEEISLQPGHEMVNFTSKTLDRTFDKIIFSAGIAGVPSKQENADVRKFHGKIMSEDLKGISPQEVKVEKASGTNAYTVAELYENRAELDKKKIVVKGRVVKVSAGIMGKNWIHIQDGSGNPGKGTHDLVVTTQDLPSVKDVVTVRGKLYTDKDFGYGYKYDVIIEEASIEK